MSVSTEPLYTPPTAQNQTGNPTETQTHRFRRHVNDKHDIRPALETYEDLWKWSTGQYHPDPSNDGGHDGESMSLFWEDVWDFTRVIGTRDSTRCVDVRTTPAENPLWFENARLNWAQNQLEKWKESDRVALIQALEPNPSNPNPGYRRLKYNELYDATVKAARALASLGVKAGDRVGSYCSNSIENVVAALAAISLGAIWTSAASDFGPKGVLERFEQVEPTVVFGSDAVSYNGKLHNHLPKVQELLGGLKAKNLTPKAVVVVPLDPTSPVQHPAQTTPDEKWISWSSFLSLGANDNEYSSSFEFAQVPFNHPLWILFSSGTTGKPKPIVHRAGGMLLQAKKEFEICAGVRQDDVFFYYTTTGWMMWNFLVGALTTGCTLVLYDGSPLRDPSVLWKLTDDLGITLFGTSAKYIEELAKKYRPRQHHNLSTIRHIYSTGSPLAPQGFDFIYQHVADPARPLMLSSITGGTDICSLFAGFNDSLPVYRGEIQCRMLGMAITAFSDDGKEVPAGTQGELVCTRPFPCQPVGFWPLEGRDKSRELVQEAKERYKKAYFEGFGGVWYHGDHVVFTSSRFGSGGGVIMLGRSDGVLNPGGVRFGSAEIYQVIESCFCEGTPSLAKEHTILDALCVGQKIEADERVILFVKLLPGVELSDDLKGRIAKEIRIARSARHVPALCIQVHDIPYTLNGKKVEVPVRKIINGAALSSVNEATLRNPECLREYVEIAGRLKVHSAKL
ncbi:putative acetoacetyl-CoA synthetase [Serendipita vermifera]|nr:putative acetoacetyl-CoA synthetase [Serendipita vermifera]